MKNGFSLIDGVNTVSSTNNGDGCYVGHGDGYGNGGWFTGGDNDRGDGHMVFRVSRFNTGKGSGYTTPKILMCVNTTDLLAVAVNTLVRFR